MFPILYLSIPRPNKILGKNRLTLYNNTYLYRCDYYFLMLKYKNPIYTSKRTKPIDKTKLKLKFVIISNGTTLLV